MRKIHLLLLSLVAMLALSAVAASGASAHEFRISGKTAAAGESEEFSGELKLEDTKGGVFGEAVAVLCSGWGLAEVLSSTDIDILTLLKLTTTVDPSVLTYETNFACATQAGICSEAVANPVHADWLVEVMSTGEVLLTEGELAGGKPGWNIECSKVAEDECTGETAVETKNETNGTVVSTFNPATETPANCTRGGTGSGLVAGSVTFLGTEAGLSVEVV